MPGVFHWEFSEWIQDGSTLLLLDVREPHEFFVMHITGSINVPRGLLEPACEYGDEETQPVLADVRHKAVVVICRSGNRSVFAARTLQKVGYRQVFSLRTGLRGWNDDGLPVVYAGGRAVPIGKADA